MYARLDESSHVQPPSKNEPRQLPTPNTDNSIDQATTTTNNDARLKKRGDRAKYIKQRIQPHQTSTSIMIDPMANIGDPAAAPGGSDMDAAGGGDGSQEVFDMSAYRSNMRKTDRIRSFMGIASGCVAGVCGLTGLSGLGKCWPVLICCATGHSDHYYGTWHSPCYLEIL